MMLIFILMMMCDVWHINVGMCVANVLLTALKRMIINDIFKRRIMCGVACVACARAWRDDIGVTENDNTTLISQYSMACVWHYYYSNSNVLRNAVNVAYDSNDIVYYY